MVLAVITHTCALDSSDSERLLPERMRSLVDSGLAARPALRGSSSLPCTGGGTWPRGAGSAPVVVWYGRRALALQRSPTHATTTQKQTSKTLRNMLAFPIRKYLCMAT